MIYARSASSSRQFVPPTYCTSLEFSSGSETWSWGTLHAFAPHFPVPEHTCEDKTSLIQRWDEWQHCLWVSVGRKEGTPGPRAQLRSAQRLAQCCCRHTRAADKNIHARTCRAGESAAAALEGITRKLLQPCWRYCGSAAIFDSLLAAAVDITYFTVWKVK